MHLLPLPLVLLLLLLPYLSAAPAGSSVTPEGSATSVSSTQDDASGSAATSSHADPGKPSQDTATRVKTTANGSHKPTVGTSKHHVVVTQTTKPDQITLRPGNTVVNPTRTNPPVPSRSHVHPPRSRSQPIAALVLEILGALAGFVFLISVLRCIYSYNRTPARDRITAILHRHQLQREMEELERNPPDPRRSVEPPPPYLAPPPQYSPGEESPRSPQHSGSSSREIHGQLAPLRPNG